MFTYIHFHLHSLSLSLPLIFPHICFFQSVLDHFHNVHRDNNSRYLALSALHYGRIISINGHTSQIRTDQEKKSLKQHQHQKNRNNNNNSSNNSHESDISFCVSVEGAKLINLKLSPLLVRQVGSDETLLSPILVLE